MSLIGQISPSSFQHDSQPTSNCNLSKKICLVVFGLFFIGSGITIGLSLTNYITVGRSFFLYGASAIGIVSIVAMVLSYIKKAPDSVLVFPTGEIPGFKSAYDKLIGNAYEKIAIIQLTSQPVVYFSPHEGSLTHFRFEDCKGKVLLISCSFEPQYSYVRAPNFFKDLRNNQEGISRYDDFVRRGGQHISLSEEEFSRVINYGWFPLRVQLVILGLMNGDEASREDV